MADIQGRSPTGQQMLTTGKGEQSHLSPRIVGIGAGAGSLDAIQGLFAAMPDCRNLAFVVCRHLNVLVTDHLETLLRHQTTMPVHHVTSGIKLEGNAIYLMPPGARMVLLKDRLAAFDDDDEDDIAVAPLDLFFHALAASAGSDAMAVLLSGTGFDGLRGAVSIQRAGGLVLVEDPENAEFGDRPKAVIEAGLASATCLPDEMPALIRHFVATGEIESRAESEASAVDVAEQSALRSIFHLLNQRFGLDLDAYRKPLVARRICRRAGLITASNLVDYAALLAEDMRACEQLHDDLMIGVTAFFRDVEAFSVLQKKVIPNLIESTRDGQPLRVWVPACATGEEAYSLAMMILDHLKERGLARTVEIIATDRDQRSLEHAQTGSYHGDQVGNLPEDMLERYMERDGDRFLVGDELRNLVTFIRHDLVQEAPMQGMILVSCRNLLIYLTPEARQKALISCRQALTSQGFLFLGPSELPGALTEGLSVIDLRWRIYQKMPLKPENPAIKHLPAVYRKRPAETIQPPKDMRPAPYYPPLLPDDDQPGIFDGMIEQNQQMLESTIDTLLASNDALRRRNRDLRTENQRLIAANSALEDIATMVAHDLKAPLRAIDHLARRLEGAFQKPSNQPSPGDDFRHMQLRLVGLHRLIDDLLTYAREDAESDPGIEQVELGGLIREVLVLIGLPPGIRLEVRPPSLTVRTRRIPLECILRNLLSNAIEHHGDAKGSIQIAILRADNALDIRMTDDGQGLRGRREGLGLAIVRQLLAAGGGHLDLTSKPDLPGTEARFTWPIEAAAS